MSKKINQAVLCKEANKRLLDTTYALRLSFYTLSKSVSVACSVFRRAVQTMDEMLKTGKFKE
jgi:hypothetical protein